MSVNKVPLVKTTDPTQLSFLLAPGESLRYRTQTPRQSLAILLQDTASPLKVNIKATDGHLYVTNQRLIYTTASQGDLESFVIEFAQLPALQFSHALKSPWFGANYWQFLFLSPQQPICDGFPRGEWFKGDITFKDGGLFDFVNVINDVINDVVNNSHIDEELPRYSET